MNNRTLRRVLFYSSCLIGFPIAFWLLVQRQTIVANVLFCLSFVAIYFSLKKIVCPSCGTAMRVISYQALHCIKCGAKYDSP